MADQNCGCNGSSTAPPGTTLPTVSSPVGSVSSYGGGATVSRGPCRPAVCPTPPISEVPERAPYCASWVDKVTTKAAGMLAMFFEGCIYKLWSKCSGFVYYDRTTEQISVQDPKYVSSVPKETSYGFLAKVVPTVHTVCVEGEDDCQQEIRQEMASQVMGDASCGSLVIARAPLCGDVPVEQSGDLDKQVRMDFLAPPNHEDVSGCPDMVRFLVSYPGTRGPSQKKVECDQWSKMYRLKLRGSQWGFIPSGSPLEALAKQVVLIQVAGGTEDDPCFEMRVLESQTGGLPSGENCDILIYRDKGLPTEGWKAQGALLGPQWLTVPRVLALGGNTNLPNYDEYKARGCKISAIVQVTQVVSGTSGQGGTLAIAANGCVITEISMTDGGSDACGGQGMCPLPTNSLTIARSGSMSGTLTESYTLLGYFIGQ